MELFLTDHGSDWYWKALELRRRVLRWPLGLEFSEQDIANEAGETTVIAAVGEDVIGTMQLRSLSPDLMKVRQVAVDDASQGTGVGRQMNSYAEAWIRSEGHKEIVLHARAVVLDFYLKLGYSVEGDEFVEVGIPHFEMRKRL